MTDNPHEKLWFVLLVQDGQKQVTQHPKHECFVSEKDALAFAKGNPVTMIDGAKLWNMVAAVQAEPSEANTMPTATAPATPECPQCGGEMVQRTAKKGPTAGAAFWGCSRYPNCRGSASIHAELPPQALA